MTTGLSLCVEEAIGRGVSRQRIHQLRHPDRHRARSEVYQAVKSGRLERPDSCSRCGRRCKPESHHADYSKPLDVEWLCRRCHRIADAELKPRSRSPRLRRKQTKGPRRRMSLPPTIPEKSKQGDEWPGIELARICVRRQMLRKDMAAAIGVAPSALSGYVAGKKKPSGDTRAVIERLYGVPSRLWTEVPSPREEAA